MRIYHRASVRALFLVVLTTVTVDAGVTTTLPTTTSTTSTTLVIPDAPDCGDFIDDDRITASDALGVLQAAVGTQLCGLCVCDVDSSGAIVASDALVLLQNAVGGPVPLSCPAGGGSILWDGGGDGTLWEDGANWVGDRVPDPCEVAVIDTTMLARLPAAGNGALVVSHNSGTHGALGVISDAEVNLSGGSLTVTGPIFVENRLAIGPATLAAARVAKAPGGSVDIFGQPTFDTVTLDADAEGSASVAIAVFNGLTINGRLRLQGQNGGIVVEGTGEQLISGTGELSLEGGGVAAYVRLRDPDEASLRFGPDLLISTNGASIAGPANFDGPVVIEAGVLVVSDWQNNHSIEVMGGSFRTTLSGLNAGTITATGSNPFTRLDGDWTNTGSISQGAGTLELGGPSSTSWANEGTIEVTDTFVSLGGTFTLDDIGSFTRSGGSVTIVGTLMNAAGLVLDDDSGDLAVGLGGSIVGGTVSATAGHELIAGVATFDGVTLNAPVNATQSGAQPTFTGGTVLNNLLELQTNGIFRIEGSGGDETLAGTGEVRFLPTGVGSSMTATNLSSLTIPATMKLSGIGGGIAGTTFDLVNEGTIDSDLGGVFPFWLNMMSGTNNGTIRGSESSIRLSGAWTNNGDLYVTPTRFIQCDQSLALDAGGSLELEITSIGGYSRLTGAGSVTLGGALIVTLGGGYEPEIGDTFPVIDTVALSGTFDSIEGLSIGNGKVFQTNFTANGLVLEVVAE